MKTAIVPVEIYDDVNSVRDKILWCQSDRILLVLSRHHRQFPSRMELHLLKRSAEKNGAQLAIVCRDAGTRVHAESLDIQIFRSIPSAERSNWQKLNPSQIGFGKRRGKTEIAAMREELPRKGFNREIPIGLLIGVVLAILAVTFTLIPSMRGWLNQSGDGLFQGYASNMTKQDDNKANPSAQKGNLFLVIDALRLQQQGLSRDEAIQEMTTTFQIEDVGEVSPLVAWWTNLPFWQNSKVISDGK